MAWIDHGYFPHIVDRIAGFVGDRETLLSIRTLSKRHCETANKKLFEHIAVFVSHDGLQTMCWPEAPFRRLPAKQCLTYLFIPTQKEHSLELSKWTRKIDYYHKATNISSFQDYPRLESQYIVTNPDPFGIKEVQQSDVGEPLEPFAFHLAEAVMAALADGGPPPNDVGLGTFESDDFSQHLMHSPAFTSAETSQPHNSAPTPAPLTLGETAEHPAPTQGPISLLGSLVNNNTISPLSAPPERGSHHVELIRTRYNFDVANVGSADTVLLELFFVLPPHTGVLFFNIPPVPSQRTVLSFTWEGLTHDECWCHQSDLVFAPLFTNEPFAKEVVIVLEDPQYAACWSYLHRQCISDMLKVILFDTLVGTLKHLNKDKETKVIVVGLDAYDDHVLELNVLKGIKTFEPGVTVKAVRKRVGVVTDRTEYISAKEWALRCPDMDANGLTRMPVPRGLPALRCNL